MGYLYPFQNSLLPNNIFRSLLISAPLHYPPPTLHTHTHTHKRLLKFHFFFIKVAGRNGGPYRCLTNAPIQPECVTLSVTDRQFPWEQSCFSLFHEGFTFTLQTLNMTRRSYLNVIRKAYFTTRGHSQRHHKRAQHSHPLWQSRRHCVLFRLFRTT